MNKIICIVGPTASGKTGFSIELAETLRNEFNKISCNSNFNDICIINADSRQLYKDFPIITAQPSLEERKDIEHKLFGILETNSQSTAGIWLEMVHKEIQRAYETNKFPILVGGTGMYIKTLTEGIAQIPKIPNEISIELENELKEKGIDTLYSKLQVIDEEYSKKIHQNDKQRILRALEVFQFTNKNLSTWHKESHAQSLYKSYKIGIGMPLDELTPYLQNRVDIMLEAGALEEAEKAYEKCPDLSSAGWSGIGCIELGNYLEKHYSLEEAKELWKKNTRAYAKRQWTWFRADKSIDWAHPLDKSKRTEILNNSLKFIAE